MSKWHKAGDKSPKEGELVDCHLLGTDKLFSRQYLVFSEGRFKKPVVVDHMPALDGDYSIMAWRAPCKVKIGLTVLEQLLSIEDPIVRDAAIRNCSSESKDKEIGSQRGAISYGFIWDETPEGHDYWEEVHKNLK